MTRGASRLHQPSDLYVCLFIQSGLGLRRRLVFLLHEPPDHRLRRFRAGPSDLPPIGGGQVAGRDRRQAHLVTRQLLRVSVHSITATRLLFTQLRHLSSTRNGTAGDVLQLDARGGVYENQAVRSPIGTAQRAIRRVNTRSTAFYMRS